MGSKQTISIYGEDLAKMFFPFVNSLKNSVYSSLVAGAFFSSKADVYSSNMHAAISEEGETTSVDGACFTSIASVFSLDDNVLEQLVGKDAADMLELFKFCVLF